MRLFAAAGASAALLLVPLASAATFGRPAEIPLGFQPVKVAIGDATQDGLADVVTANAAASGLTLLPGKGDGSFEKQLDLAGATGARALAFGDFDGDGAEELAVATPSSILIYASLDGSLLRRQIFAAPAPTFLATGDFDSDGNLDLAAASLSQKAVLVFRGRGDNTFEAPTALPIGIFASSLVVADLNSDDAPDIAAAGGTPYILIGIGDGSFESYKVAGTASVRALASEDLDADGDSDLVALGGLNSAYALINDGAGIFAQSNAYRVGASPVALILDDVNMDGSTDLISTNRGTHDISILLGTGDGTFRPQSRVQVGRGPSAMSVGDLNSDGRGDFVVVNGKAKSLEVLLNGTDTPQPTVCLVPRVVHKTLAAARGLVTRAHCSLSPIRRKYSSRVKRNRVIAQTPAPAARLPENAGIALVISRGPRR